MIRSLLILGFLWVTLSVNAATLSVRPQKGDGVYPVGEKVTFEVAVEGDTPVEFEWTMSRDGTDPITKGKGTTANGKAVIEGQLDRPGFLRCEVKWKEGEKVASAMGGAAIEPEKIGSTQQLPDDFHAFWKGRVAQLALVPMNAELTPIPVKVEGVEVFDVTLQTGGIPVRGYLARPSGKKGMHLPAILLLHGAGVRSADMNRAMHWAKQGMLALDINAHGLPNGRANDFYREQAKTAYQGYPHWGLDSREENYFVGMFLRAYRAADFLCQQAEWDRKVLVASGGSQGGAQAIAVAALHPKVSLMISHVPAMCEHSGRLTDDPFGWPGLLRPVAGGTEIPANRIATAQYIDMTNFARQVSAPAFFSVGFIDTTCRPTTVYATFNALPAKKKMHHSVRSAHAVSGSATKEGDEIVRRHVANAEAVPWD